MSGTKGIPHYSLETKLQAVRMHEEDGLTYTEAALLGDARKQTPAV